MSNLPLSERLRGAGLDTLKEILREAELHLMSQQTVALAADQRAVTLIGFLSAAVVVLVGAATSFALGSQANIALTVICLMVATGLMAAAIIALSTAKPSPFDFAGSSPEDWVNDVAEEKPLEVSLAEQCQNHAEAISANHARMALNGKRLIIALYTAVITVAVGGAAFVLTITLLH